MGKNIGFSLSARTGVSWQEGAAKASRRAHACGGGGTPAGCVWEGLALRGFITGLPKMCYTDMWIILS